MKYSTEVYTLFEGRESIDNYHHETEDSICM